MEKRRKGVTGIGTEGIERAEKADTQGSGRRTYRRRRTGRIESGPPNGATRVLIRNRPERDGGTGGNGIPRTTPCLGGARPKRTGLSVLRQLPVGALRHDGGRDRADQSPVAGQNGGVGSDSDGGIQPCLLSDQLHGLCGAPQTRIGDGYEV